MPSYPSPPLLTFTDKLHFVVESNLQVILGETEIDFEPVVIIPLNTFTPEYARSLALARQPSETVWMTLVVSDAGGAPKQFVLQGRSDSFTPKVSGKRDGGVGLGTWMNSKLRPTPIPIPEELRRFPTAPPILPAAIERLATSVADNYFTQPNGKTRDDVTASLMEFHKDLETLGSKPKRGRTVPVGQSADHEEDDAPDQTPVRVESAGGAKSASPAVEMSPVVRRNRGPTLHAPWRIQPAILPDPRIRIGSAQPRYDRVGDSLIMRQ